MDPLLPCWASLRALSDEDYTLRVHILKVKFLARREFRGVWEKGLEVASERAVMADDNSMVDAAALTHLLPALLLGRNRPGDAEELKTVTWLSTVQARLARLKAGEFQGLIDEALGPLRGEGEQRRRGRDPSEKELRKLKGARGTELVLQGQPSKGLAHLASKGVLKMEDAGVRQKFTELQDPYGDGDGDVPVLQWEEFVRTHGAEFALPPPSSPLYQFELGSTVIQGADGTSQEVDTLEYVLNHLDVTSAPGISGTDFTLLRGADPAVVAVLLEPFFGRGVWNHEDPFHQRIHNLLVSNRGVGLDKKGAGMAADLRPIGVGDALRRVAAKCHILQEGGAVGARLATKGQFGVGFKNGTEVIYSLTSRAMDALHAKGIPCGTSESDAWNAYCSIFRSAIQRGLARLAPGLLPVFDFLYGPHAEAKAYFYGGGARPMGWCFLLSGVHQGDGFGPLFFAVGFEQLLEDVRVRMRNLSVDSTMVGEVIKLTAGAEVTRVASGGVYEPSPGDVFRLRQAPTYLELEAPGAEVGELEVALELLPGGEEPQGGGDLGGFSAPWEVVKLEANPLVVAYLDDVKLVDRIFLARRFAALLRDRGPLYGLFFGNRAKNFVHVIKPFEGAARAMFPDAVFVDDDSPGDGPADQLKRAVAANGLSGVGAEDRLLITSTGVESLMGSPYRFVEVGGGRRGSLRSGLGSVWRTWWGKPSVCSRIWGMRK
jgi:hypothetical protein